MDCNEISCLTLKTKEIAIEVDGANLWFDFARIVKCREDIYINATPIAQTFKTRIDKYLKSEQTQRYIKELENIFLTNPKWGELEKEKQDSNYPLNGQIESKKQPKTILEKYGFVYKRSGRYGGTWLHRKLFLNFARWLSPRFEIMCDQIIEQIVVQADGLEEGRNVLKRLQRPLNDAIKLKLVDTGIKTETAYIQFAVMVKRLIGCSDDRDNYTKTQLGAARLIIEEYRAMIIHGGKTSLKEMNEYLKDCSCNLAWKK